MRWYVSRNGETRGPVDEAAVVEWIRGGMTDAMVRDEAGGNWVALRDSPFAMLVPKTAATSVPSGGFGQAIGALLFLGGVGGATYYFVFFETSVSIPTGGRFSNLSLMQAQQQGIILSLAAAALGLVLMLALRKR